MVETCPIRPKWLHRPCNYAALIFSRSNLYLHAPRLVPGKISFELPPLCQTSLCLSLINQLVSSLGTETKKDLEHDKFLEKLVPEDFRHQLTSNVEIETLIRNLENMR